MSVNLDSVPWEGGGPRTEGYQLRLVRDASALLKKVSVLSRCQER
jgi:hypothetical protein